MSDRGRSPEEIERAIARRQDELSEDLEDLEYRLSRRGVKDQAREQVSERAHAAADRAHEVADQAVELGERATGRVREAGSRAAHQVSSLGRSAAESADEYRYVAALLAAGAAVTLGILLARSRSSRDGSSRL